MRDKLVSMIKDGCLADQVDQLSDLMKDSIRMKTHLSEERYFHPSESKIGGRPWLPEGVEWPKANGRSMSFLGQFDLAEFVGLMNNSELPQEGILYFFYDALRETWINSDRDLKSWKVIYYNGDLSSLKLTPTPSDFALIKQFYCCKVEFSMEITLPSTDSVYFEVERYQRYRTTNWLTDVPWRIKLNEEQLSEYKRLMQFLDDSYDRGNDPNRMFGHPDCYQWETQSGCPSMMNRRPAKSESEYEEQVTEWELLFQLSSDKNADMDWFEDGRLNFWIHKTALRESNFDNICMIMNCV